MVLIGPSASGKSSYALERIKGRLGSVLELNRDILRAEYQREFQKLTVTDRPDYSKWRFKNEKIINKMFMNRFREHLDYFIKDYNTLPGKLKERTIVWSCTNINQDRLDSKVIELINEAKEKNVNLILTYKLFIVDEEVLNKRDRNRFSGVGESVIHKQLNQLMTELPKILRKVTNHEDVIVSPALDKKSEYERLVKLATFVNLKNSSGYQELPSAVLIDIDGTVASMVGKRGPFDWSKVLLDDPIIEHEELILYYIKNNNIENVIFLTGRDGIAREDTLTWLNTKSTLVKGLNDIKKEFILYNRKKSDQRKDSIIKQEIFLKEIAFKYNVKAVFDDRPQVVKMWWNLDLKCYQLANPYLEF